MRSGIRGVLAGALTLIALEVVVQTPAAGRVAGLFAVPGQIARRFLDPTIPAIPEIRGKGSAAQAAGAAVAGIGAVFLPKTKTANLRGTSSPPTSTSAYPDPFAPPQSPGGD